MTLICNIHLILCFVLILSLTFTPVSHSRPCHNCLACLCDLCLQAEQLLRMQALACTSCMSCIGTRQELHQFQPARLMRCTMRGEQHQLLYGPIKAADVSQSLQGPLKPQLGPS